MTVAQPLPRRSAKAMKLRPPPDWLWKPYVPIGRLTMMDGAEGIGKGFFAIHVSLLVLKQGGNVLWFTAEDDPEEDLYRRLLAGGWNPKKHGDVMFYDGLNESDIFGVPKDRTKLALTIKEDEPGVVVLDPGRSFLKPPKTDQQMSYNDDAMVRPGLQALNQTASKFRTAMMFIHHWNRDSSAAPSARFSGSGAFSQNARHRVTLARYGNEEDAEACFAVLKTNITTRGHLRYYRLEFVPELESCRWVDGGPNTSDADLDAWWRRQDQQAKSDVLIDHTDEVISHLKKLNPGDRVPSRTNLVALTGVPYRYVEAAMQKVSAEGWVQRVGPKGLVWQGSGDSNGAAGSPS